MAACRQSSMQAGEEQIYSGSDGDDDNTEVAEGVYDASDHVALSADKQKLLKVKESEPKKTYYPMQEFLAERIICRIKYILWLYGNKKQLSDFKAFDFQIYTARFCMLEEQTLHRLLDPEASCFNSCQYEDFDHLRQIAQIRVSKYQAQRDVLKRSKELQAKARSEADTLFLIIADEAHWGLCKACEEPSSRSGANDQLINCWTNELPNVIVLLVTATSINLKSDESRLLNQMVIVLKNNDSQSLMSKGQDGEKQCMERLRLVERERNTYKDIESGEIHRKESVEKEFILHHVRWAEAHLDEMNNGVIVRLRIAHKKEEDHLWLAMSSEVNEFGIYGLEATSDDAEALELLIEGGNDSGVEIKSADGDYQLVVVTKEVSGIKKYGLGFILHTVLGKGEHQKNILIKSQHFTLKTDCGEDVLVISVKEVDDSLHGRYVCYNTKDKAIMLEKPPPEGNCPELPTYPLKYCFVVHYYKSVEQVDKCDIPSVKLSKQYLSLNFIFNSMRNRTRDEKLIRGDDHFAKMVKYTRCSKLAKDGEKKENVLPEAFMYLTAEYSYFILLMNDFRNCKHFSSECFESLLKEKSGALADFTKARQGKLEGFVSELRSFVKEDQLDVIPPKTFMSVRKYYNDLCIKRIEHLCNKGHGNETADVLKCVLQCLFFMDLTDKVPSESWTKLHDFFMQNEEILTELDKSFRKLTEDEFKEMKDEILGQFETYNIVNRVFLSDAEEQDGKMVVIRVPRSKNKSVPPGNVVYATLSLARKLASDGDFGFEIVRDFGRYKVSQITEKIEHPQYRMQYRLQPSKCEYQDKSTLARCCSGDECKPCSSYEVKDGSLVCTNCSHKHRDITNYEHLNTLPCILILVSKGRLGDTFPEGFFAMDCRLMYDPVPKLSTIIQEFGRLCRYTERSGSHRPPYILTGPTLDKFFAEALSKYAQFHGLFVEKYLLDGYMSKTENKLIPKKCHADRGNTEKHHFRILLEAEPQIGKTGVYLKTISLLRQIIERDEEEVVEYDDHPDMVSEEEEESSTDEIAEGWKYPYWKMLDSGRFKDYAPMEGKYVRTEGSKQVTNVHGSKPCSKMSLSAHPKEDLIPVNTYRTYRINDPKHPYCTRCFPNVNAIQKEVAFENQNILVSVPTSKRYLPFLKLIGLGSTEIKDTSSFPSQEPSEERGKVLETWIFTPSYKRSRDAYLNYKHTMVARGTQERCSFQHFVVVRENEFSAYCSNWDRTHVIVQLPPKMEIRGKDITVESGGIGYSRLFIQKFARFYHQDLIFMIDDNVTCVFEVTTKKQDESRKEYIVRKDRYLEMTDVPLFKVLKHMESQFLHPVMDLRKIEGYELYPDESLEDLKRYIGPDEKYGVTGMLRERKGILRVKKAFKKTHVYALILLNLKALEDHKIQYEPLPNREDMSLNKECDGKNLWVCKYNRFMMRKVNLSSNIIQPVFCWPDSAKLDLDGASKKKACDPVKCLEKLLKWIHVNKPPKRIELCPDDDDDSISNERRVCQQIPWKTRAGTHHLLIFCGNKLSRLEKYFQETSGIGGFSQHLILLCSKFCRENKLALKKDFEKLIQPIFQNFTDFEIYSSHSVNTFDVPYALVYLCGMIASPKDGKCEGNIHVAQPVSESSKVKKKDEGSLNEMGPQNIQDDNKMINSEGREGPSPSKKAKLLDHLGDEEGADIGKDISDKLLLDTVERIERDIDQQMSLGLEFVEACQFLELTFMSDKLNQSAGDQSLHSQISDLQGNTNAANSMAAITKLEVEKSSGLHEDTYQAIDHETMDWQSLRCSDDIQSSNKTDYVELSLDSRATSEKPEDYHEPSCEEDMNEPSDQGIKLSESGCDRNAQEESSVDMYDVNTSESNNSMNTCHGSCSQLTLNQLEIYNTRTKKTRPLKDGTKLSKCENIQLRQNCQSTWLDRKSMNDVKKRYHITHR